MTAKNKALRHCMNTVMLLCWCNNDTRLLMKHIHCTPIYSSSIYKCVTIYRLKQNADMTPLLPLVTRPQLVKLTVTQLRLTSSVGEFNSTAIDLGIVLDNHLSMIHTWQAVSQSCFTSCINYALYTKGSPHVAFVHCSHFVVSIPHSRTDHLLQQQTVQARCCS